MKNAPYYFVAFSLVVFGFSTYAATRSTGPTAEDCLSPNTFVSSDFAQWFCVKSIGSYNPQTNTFPVVASWKLASETYGNCSIHDGTYKQEGLSASTPKVHRGIQGQYSFDVRKSPQAQLTMRCHSWVTNPQKDPIQSPTDPLVLPLALPTPPPAGCAGSNSKVESFCVKDLLPAKASVTLKWKLMPGVPYKTCSIRYGSRSYALLTPSGWQALPINTKQVFTLVCDNDSLPLIVDPGERNQEAIAAPTKPPSCGIVSPFESNGKLRICYDGTGFYPNNVDVSTSTAVTFDNISASTMQIQFRTERAELKALNQKTAIGKGRYTITVPVLGSFYFMTATTQESIENDGVLSVHAKEDPLFMFPRVRLSLLNSADAKIDGDKKVGIVYHGMNVDGVRCEKTVVAGRDPSWKGSVLFNGKAPQGAETIHPGIGETTYRFTCPSRKIIENIKKEQKRMRKELDQEYEKLLGEAAQDAAGEVTVVRTGSPTANSGKPFFLPAAAPDSATAPVPIFPSARTSTATQPDSFSVSLNNSRKVDAVVTKPNQQINRLDVKASNGDTVTFRWNIGSADLCSASTRMRNGSVIDSASAWNNRVAPSGEATFRIFVDGEQRTYWLSCSKTTGQVSSLVASALVYIDVEKPVVGKPVIGVPVIDTGTQLPGSAQTITFDISNASFSIVGDSVCSARGGTTVKAGSDHLWAAATHTYTYYPQRKSTCRIIATNKHGRSEQSFTLYAGPVIEDLSRNFPIRGESGIENFHLYFDTNIASELSITGDEECKNGKPVRAFEWLAMNGVFISKHQPGLKRYDYQVTKPSWGTYACILHATQKTAAGEELSVSVPYEMTVD